MNSNPVPEDSSDKEATMVNSENGCGERFSKGSSNTSDHSSSYDCKEHPDATKCDNEPGSRAAFEDESGDGYEDGSESDSENDSEIEGGGAAPMKSLVQLAQEALLRVLSKAVDSEQGTARYCCSGSILAVKPKLAEEQTKVEEKGTTGRKIDTAEKARNQKAWRYGDVQAGPKVTPAVTIRWDDPLDGKKPRELAVVMEEDRADDMCCCPDCRQGHYFERIHSLVGMLVTVPKMADRNLDF